MKLPNELRLAFIHVKVFQVFVLACWIFLRALQMVVVPAYRHTGTPAQHMSASAYHAMGMAPQFEAASSAGSPWASGVPWLCWSATRWSKTSDLLNLPCGCVQKSVLTSTGGLLNFSESVASGILLSESRSINAILPDNVLTFRSLCAISRRPGGVLMAWLFLGPGQAANSCKDSRTAFWNGVSQYAHIRT